MSVWSTLFGSGGIKSLQEGFASGATSTGTVEDVRYLDVTITAVVVAKCAVEFVGGGGSNAGVALTPSTNQICTARLTSTTNLRIATTAAAANITGRWRVIEMN